MADESALARIADGSAWEEFCDGLKRAGEAILREKSPDDLLDRAEGFRYLSRLTRLALEKYVEHADPLAPRFYRLSHETAKIGIDNPDSYYMNATVSGAHEYRVSGNRGTIPYLGFGTYYGDYGKSGRSGCSGYLEADQLTLDARGDFELVLSCQKRPGNWLPMEPDTNMLIVRQNFLDREREELAALRIERLGAEGPPAPLDPAALAEGLRQAAAYVGGTAHYFADWAEDWATRPNELRAHDVATKQSAHGDPNIFFYMGYWELGPDEALVVDADPPECDYWNFEICNHWLESLDYRYRPVHTNKHTTTYNPDGSFTVVIAHRNPNRAELPNWLDTEGHGRGTMGLRWVKAASHPQPRTRLVKLSELAR